MSTPALVEGFYEHIWNRGDLDAASGLLANDFRFRGSLGTEMVGHDAFKEYVGSVRGALPITAATSLLVLPKTTMRSQKCASREGILVNFEGKRQPASSFIGSARRCFGSRTEPSQNCGFSAIWQAWMRC
jgi:hypothetical protein